MGEYTELINKYNNVSLDKIKKEALDIFPKKEGKIIFPHQESILIPSKRTLIIFTSNGSEPLKDNIIKKFDRSLDCNVISVFDIVNTYSCESNFFEIINDVLEEEIITSLEDGFVTVVDYIYTDILKRAILLKAFEKYYDNSIDITIDMSLKSSGKKLYNMLSSICHLKEDRRNKFNLGVDINYIIPYYLEDKIKIIVNKKG